MAPTPEAGRRLVPLIALSVMVAAAGAIAFVFLDSSETTSPPPADDIASVLGTASPAGGEFPGLTEAEFALGDDCVRLVVADDEAERGQGLRSRETLGPYDGMLFVNQSDTTTAYTMSGVTVPLDIGWYDHGGKPVDRTEMEPCPEGGPDCPLYSPDGRYRFAVETLRGELPTGSLGGCPS
jgi:uncharacterized membrane protein (UPF0127 family)